MNQLATILVDGERSMPIDGFVGKYSVTSLGRIISHRAKGVIRDKILKPKSNGMYANIALVKEDGKIVYPYIHRLVAFAFIENPENKSEVNHKNGIRSDNRVENLEWTTRKENNDHALHTLGHWPSRENNIRGRKHYLAKLTELKVVEIRNSGKSCYQLAKIYGVSKATIMHARNRRTWKHVA